MNIGKKSHILGNYDVKGNVFIESGSEIYGTLKTTGDIFCGKKSIIHGNLDSNGDIRVEEKSKVGGNIKGDKIFLSKSASLNGELFAKGSISFFTDSKKSAEEKIERFDKDTDIVDEVKDMLE
jgi:predicted acyltransferase (DUF342 family)